MKTSSTALLATMAAASTPAAWAATTTLRLRTSGENSDARKQSSKVSTTATTSSSGSERRLSGKSGDSTKAHGGCSDPLKATLDALQCISESNATCAGAAYNTKEFKKIHNNIDTNTVIDGAGFWDGIFALIPSEFLLRGEGQ